MKSRNVIVVVLFSLFGALIFVFVKNFRPQEKLISVVLSFDPISQEGFLEDPGFVWLHRHCQPANPFDPANHEGGWLKSLVRIEAGKLRLVVNSNVEWGSGKILTLTRIRESLQKSLEEGERFDVVDETKLDFMTSKTDAEAIGFLQKAIIFESDRLEIKKPEEMNCFGRFKHIEWDRNQALLRTESSSFLKRFVSSNKLKTDSKSDGPGAMDSQKNYEELESINVLQVQFKNQTKKERLARFLSGEIDFVGNVPLSEVSSGRLRSELKQRPEGDLFVFFARLTGTKSKVGEFLAKALNRGELHGLMYSGASIRPNFHIFPFGFLVGDSKSVESFFPEFNFSSVADARTFLGNQKPSLTTIKIGYRSSDVASTFIDFFRLRLDTSYKVKLVDLIHEAGSDGDWNSQDVILDRLKNSDSYLKDLLAKIKLLYPDLVGDLSHFQQKIFDDSLSVDQKADILQKFEKYLVEKFLVVPVGDVSSGYFLRDGVKGTEWESHIEAPLFFKSFLTQ